MKASEAIETIQFDLEIGGEIHSQVLRDAADVAIRALSKQIPKKPIAHQCTTCGDAVLPFEGSYCSNCGQKLDWSDEE